MTYKLYFDEKLIGDIEYADADFPSFSGKFNLILNQSDTLSTQILNYIDFSARQDRYYASLENAVEYEAGENEQEELELEEANYENIIETDSWKIVDENNETTKILIPTFGFDKTIVWRLNVE
ncbi:MAG: hypothetical protein IPL10_03490 [Bacteroidetes bacterium]|nr:hypothetical protein [Bacteroidota bacterium]